jgi:type VI secretion system protein ImpE
MSVASAEAAFKAGDPAGALQALQQAVRQDPGNVKLRIFLAQLLLVAGDWDRAHVQLDVVAEMDAGNLPLARTYQAAIQCEKLRTSIFRGERAPLIFGEPEPWVALLVQSLSLLGQGRIVEAAAVRGTAFEQAPTVTGSINGMHFEWIADADSRLGPVLELLLDGKYFWVPFKRIQRLTLEAPSDARDLVWVPAQVTWANGGEAFGLIPVRYPGSEQSEDPAVRLSRKTEWRPAGEDTYLGLGQRVLATDGIELGLLELRDLAIDTVP